MTQHNIMTWELPWDRVYDIDYGRLASSLTAEHILREMRRCGAMGVRMHGTHLDWLRPIYEATGTPVMTLLNWDSGFEKMPVKEANEQWLKYARDSISDHRPDLILMNREAKTQQTPNDVNDVRAMAFEILGRHVPVHVFWGRRYFPGSAGAYTGQPFYNIWDDSRFPGTHTPAERIARLRQDPHWSDPVTGTCPWLCPHMDAWDLTSPLAPMADWLSGVTELRDLGAVLMGLYRSPFGPNHDIGNPINEELLERMQAASEVLAQ